MVPVGIVIKSVAGGPMLVIMVADASIMVTNVHGSVVLDVM